MVLKHLDVGHVLNVNLLGVDEPAPVVLIAMSPAPLTAALVKVPSETWLAPVLVSAEIFLLSLLATA